MIVLSRYRLDGKHAQEAGKYAEIIYFDGDPSGLSDKLRNDTEAMLSFADIITAKKLDMFPSLKWIQLTSDGYDGIDPGYLLSRGIKVTYANGVYGIPIAEDVFAKILAYTRKYEIFLQNKHDRSWKKESHFIELAGKHMVILGTGDIGRETAKRAQAFGMRVSGYNRSGKPSEYFNDTTNDLSALRRLLNKCDFLVIALPLNKETYHLCDASLLGEMPAHSMLVNIARGRIIDETALVAALKDKKIAYASLDVFETEPLPPDSPLWEMENVYITPHVSGNGDRCTERLLDLFVHNLRNFPEYINMKHIIDLEAL